MPCIGLVLDTTPRERRVSGRAFNDLNLMHSPIDKALSARLRRLPTYCADEEPSRSTVYARAAELATRLSIGAAFKERLTPDLARRSASRTQDD